jgi:hypothetical protein
MLYAAMPRPSLAAPDARRTQAFATFVPRYDLDAVELKRIITSRRTWMLSTPVGVPRSGQAIVSG